jgi:hypothetical protein
MLVQMTSDQLILLINQELKAPWTVKETARGKSIHVDWSWAVVINQCIKKYEQKGWTVIKHVEIDGLDRRLFLCFKNKTWTKTKKI